MLGVKERLPTFVGGCSWKLEEQMRGLGEGRGVCRGATVLLLPRGFGPLPRATPEATFTLSRVCTPSLPSLLPPFLPSTRGHTHSQHSSVLWFGSQMSPKGLLVSLWRFGEVTPSLVGRADGSRQLETRPRRTCWEPSPPLFPGCHHALLVTMFCLTPALDTEN